MPIANLVFAAALLAAPAIPDAAIPSDPPPLVVAVTAADDIRPVLVTRILDEAAAIWRSAGVTLAWRQGRPASLSTLRVTIGHDRGRPSESNVMPLAWILFDDDAVPEHDVFVSCDNVLALMRQARDVVGDLELKPRAELETMLGRALGRALAHEIGHYLLASKVHTESGLMQTRRTLTELFSTYRTRFQISPAQRRQVAARVEQLVIAQRSAASGSSEMDA